MFDGGVVNCHSGMSGGTPTQGFAVIKLSSDGTVISAEVSLKDARRTRPTLSTSTRPRGACLQGFGRHDPNQRPGQR
jgi:hypothetical protein